MDYWTKLGLGLLVAAFCAVMVAAMLPLGDPATEVVFLASRAVNVVVLVTWAARWALRWRGTGGDAISAMEMGTRAQRFLRGCLAALFALLVTLGAVGPDLSEWAPLLRLLFVLAFAATSLSALGVVIQVHLVGALGFHASATKSENYGRVEADITGRRTAETLPDT